jgi:hypothetical protein
MNLSTRLAVMLFLSLLFVRCSHCVDETVSEIRSADQRFKAVLELRHCGSAQGWAVWLDGTDLERRQVFLASVPSSVSVDRFRNAVAIRWSQSDLVIKVPAWVKPFAADKKYGTINITYEENPIPEPTE